MTKEIDILVVEPGKAPYPARVEDTLDAFQKVVGGPIEPVSIHVIENLTISLTADAEKVREDETVKISLTVEHGTPSTVAWALTRNGEGVSVALDDNGGTLTFDGAGEYVLTTTVTDELGKEYTATLPLEVRPVIVLTLEAPSTTHIDRPAPVTLSGTDLDVVWEVTSTAGVTVENDLTNEGGEIMFPSAGNYTVTASVTDDLGRTFTTSQTIRVWDTMMLILRNKNHFLQSYA